MKKADPHHRDQPRTNKFSIAQALCTYLSRFVDFKQFVNFIPNENSHSWWGINAPCDVNGTIIEYTPDRCEWLSAIEAVNAANLLGKGGVGFVINEDDNFFYIELKHCLSPDGELSPLAIKAFDYFPGVVAEVNLAGDGLQLYGATLGYYHQRRAVKLAETLGIELYVEAYIEFTGKPFVYNGEIK